MSSSNGDFGPPSDGEPESAASNEAGPTLPEGESVFELSVEAGDVVMVDTPSTRELGGHQRAPTDPALDPAAIAMDATMDEIAFDATMIGPPRFGPRFVTFARNASEYA